MRDKNKIYTITFFILGLLSFTMDATGVISDANDTGNTGFISYSINSNSWMTLSGTTNVNSFECLSERGVSGGIVMADSGSCDNRVNFSDMHLSVEINSFDCKNPRITRDMYNALGGDGNSGIEIKLLDIKPIDSNTGISNGNFKANAVITVKGQSSTEELIVEWHQSGQFEYHFEGSTELFMSDFDIDPPSPALGLVQVNDKITVRFNYVVQTSIVSMVD